MQNNSFSCEYCSFTTKRKYNLQRHQNALHILNNSNIKTEKKDIKTEKKDIKTEKKDINTKKKDIKTEKKISKLKFKE